MKERRGKRGKKKKISTIITITRCYANKDYIHNFVVHIEEVFLVP